MAKQSRSISYDIGGIVRGLKLLALKHNVVIFLICHTNKTKNDGLEELNLGDVRDSSFIEQEADAVFYVWRDTATSENESIIKIAKNRKRGIINKKVRLVFDHGRLWEKGSEPKQFVAKKGNF
jgi:replicative DNA helicase